MQRLCLASIILNSLTQQLQKRLLYLLSILRDSTAGNQLFKIKISPNRKVNRYDIFANEKWLLPTLKRMELFL
jgi:hypothetical protein